MARFLEDYKPTKKKKKETPKPQKVEKSPSVTKVNNKASNSTFMGGGSSVKKTEQRTSTPAKLTKPSERVQRTPARSNTPQRVTDTGTRNQMSRTSRITDAQYQKTYGTPRRITETAEDKRKEREERRLAAQRQKSGLNDQPTLAQREAANRALKKTPALMKESAKGAAYGHLTTLNDIASIKSQGNGKSREEIYDPNLAERSRQQAEQRVKKYQAKTQETEDAIQKLTKNAKGLEKAYYGAVESGTGMLTDMALGMGTQGGSLAAMFSRTYGASRGKAQQEGATQAEDRAYAAAQAAKEVGTELMFPGAGLARGYAGKQGLKLADTAANILTKNLRGRAADIGGAGVRLLGGVLEENAEELAGWGLDPLIKEFTYGKNARTRNAQQAMKERSNALRAEIRNEDDARAAAAYLSSDDFFEQTVNAYREAGLSKKDAEEVADRMRDYLTASLTGDTDSMEQIEDEVSKRVAGSKKLEWDFDELKNTIASTTLLTAATGLPGTGMTAVKGAALRDQLGDDGVRALANTAIDFEDGEMSLKAKAMKARLDSGNELTSTQVYDLQVGMQEQIRKDTQREESSRRMADKRIKSDNLITPYRQNENGGIDLDEATEASYREHVSKAKDIIDGLTNETKESLTANEKVDGSKAIAGFQTGVFTIEDANTLNYSNTTVRAAFEEATGVDLGQYIVKNKDGSVNIPATNTKTKDALFAIAADNLVKSAQAETENWMDNTKGQVVTQVSARMGAQGSAVLQQALDDVDERDRSKYMMTANATDMLYQAARNMGTEWSDVASEATKMFPGISESKLKMMYEAGLADREMANDKARGRQVRMGQALTEMGEQETATGKVFIDTEVPVKGSVIRTFTEIAKNLGADIHFVDYIYDSENNPIAGANGSYDPNTNTFYLNVATGAETNIGYIFMHETTHYLKTYAPEQYQALENLVRERWFAFNPSQMQDAIARKIEAYKRATKGQQVLTEEQALEEIIADASHDFINDPEFANQIAEEDMGLAKAVLDSIRNALRMLRRIFASGSIDDDTHMNSLFRELDIMAEAEKLWLDAYKVAVQNSAINAVNEWQDNVNEQTRYSTMAEKWENDEKLSHSRFNSWYSAHKLNLRGKDNLADQIADIKENGFISNTAMSNVMPASINDYADTNIDWAIKTYGARKGDTVLLVPRPYVDLKNDIIKNGFKPRDYEIVTVERDYQPYYELYSKAYDDTHQTRFSVSEPVERVKDLIAVHNLKADDIRNTFELGGFPMPSIAVTKDSMGHDMYGDISLLFGSDTIDPKFFRSNQVFGGDAYTPTFPATQYKPNEDIVEKFRDIYYDNAKTLGYDAMRPFYELAEDAENVLNRNGGEQGLIDRYKNDIRAMRTFLKINGKDVEDVVKRTEDTISETEQKLCQHFIDTLGEDAIREFEGESIPHGKAMMDHRKNWTYDHSDEIKSAYKDFLNREFSFSDEEISNVLDNMSLFETMKLVRNALNYLNNGPTTVKEEVDRAATDKAIEDAAHELGYEEWIDGLLTGIEEKRGIRNDKEFFTRNGNRRSWDTLHDDITLENVVKAMRSELAAGGNGFLWKNPKGAAQKQYKSLDEIRADEDRLQQLPEEEYKALEQAATQKLSDVLSDVVDNNPGRFMNSFGAVLDTGEYIAEILNETRDKATMQRKLKKDYSLDVSDEQMDRIAEAIDEIANIPTGYFEAKPRRAVGFDEVKAAIIPQTMDEDIKAGLESRGIPFYEYDPEVDGDRTEVVNRAATEKNLRFSISEDAHVMYTPKGVEVVQNPTDSEYNSMREEILAEYPWLRGTGDPLLRKTYDESGNEYYWNAFEAMHSQVEPYINKEYNTRTSQQWKWYEKPDKDDYPIDYSKQGYRFSITDSDGNELSDGQVDYFKDSQARDNQGRLVPVYHTTNHGGFTIFDPSYSDDKRSLFFASNWDVSQTYGRNADRKYRFEDYSFKSLNDFAKAYAENFSNNLNDPENDILEQVVNALRIHIEKNSMPAFDLGDTMFERVKNYMKIAEAGDVRADKYRIEMEGAYGGMVRASSYDELLGKLSRQMSNNQSKSGYYECYLNLENPLIVDAQNQSWNNIPYGEYSEDAVLAIKNLTVQDMGNGIYVNIWGERKKDGEWQEFRDSDTIEFEYLTVDGEYEIPEKAWDEVYDFLVKHGLSSDYAYEHSDAFFDFNGLDTFDKDGRKIESNVRRYRTRELAALADAKGYDSVIIRNCYDIGAASHLKGEGLSDIYIAFSSNQVKDINNQDPTENPDIRYSITPEDDAMEWLASQYELDDVPLEDPKAEEGRVRMAKSKKDFIKSRNALWNERWLTEGKVLDTKSVRKNIKELVTGAMMNSDVPQKYKLDLVDKTLVDAKSAFWLMKEGKHSEAADLLWDSAVKMIENVDFIEDENFKHYKDLRDYMRTTSFRLGEEYWSDVDFSAFRKRNFGKIKLVKGETNIDEIYQELQERWPEWFDEDEQMTAPDQLLHIEEVLDAIQPYKIAYSSEEAEQLAGDIASDLYDIVYEGEEYKSIADTYKERYDAKTKALKERHQEALRKVREEGDLKVRKEKAKFKEYKEQKKNAKEKAKHFGRIAANIDWLTDRLLNETKDKNIPEGFRKSLAHMLMQFDMQTERSKKLEEKYGAAKKTLQMRELQKRLEQIAKEDDTGEFRYDGYLFYLMDALAEKVDGKPIDSLDTEDLIVIDTMLRSIKHNFSNYNKVRLEEEKVAIANIGDNTIAAMEERIQKFGKRKNRTGTLGLFDKLVNEGEQTPIYLFERLDPTGQGIGAMYKELRRGEDQHIRNMNFLRNRFQSMFQEYFNKSKPGSELESWRDDSQAQTFNLENGAITLNPAQIMSLYCLSKRTQAMGHILGSGIVASPINVGQKLHDQFKGKDEQVNSVRITYSEIQDIITKLTPEQMKLADEMQALLNNEMAAWGNETSLEMHGIKLFREKDYFPIKSSGESLAKTADSFDVQEKIKNFGFTKPLVRNANNAIMIDDIFSVVADHCNKMSLYNSMAIPISDFMRVYNYKQRREDGTVKTSVQAMIGDAFTRKVNDYIMKFIGDVNGNTKTRSDAVNDLMNKALANYKKASIGANFRVALQQPTAIFRSLMAIDAKYFVGIKPISPADIKEMFEHCPIALWKSWGHYDMDMGRDIEDIMMNNDWSRWDTATMGAYGALDNWTWSLIWQAVKKEVKANNPNVKVGSDEFFRLCNERASEVFDKTQVVDSIFHRSDTMRSKITLTKMATSFMAEPTLTFNVFRDSLIKANEMWKDGDKTGSAMMFNKMAFVLALNAAAVSASAAIWDAIRGKGGGDDDDDEGFVELWLANFKQNFLDNAPWAQWNNIYFVKDIISLKDGWGTSNMALEGFETIFKGMDQLKKKITEGSDKSWYDILMNLFGGFGYVTGVPIKTIMRDVKAVFEKFGIDVFAEDGSDEDESLMDTIANKMGYRPVQHKGDGEAKVKDSFFARLGIGKTEEEKEQEAFDKKAEEIAGKTADLTGEAKDKKVWSYVTTYMKSQNGDKPLADVIQEGDYKKVQEYRDMYVAAGGDTEYFDERIFATSKSAMKKTIVYDPTDAQIEAQENIKTYLLHHGMSDAELSEIAYNSYTAKQDMKIAFMINDKDAMLETLEPLVRAGLSYEDLERIWKNRNRIDVMKYKNSKGRYADRLKSTGKFIWPTNGQITSYFGYRNAPTRGASSNHPAIDIGADMGAEVVASDGGVVIYTGWNGGYGNSVGIKHDNGMVTYYNHLSAWNVKEGDTVAQGQPIANVGSTGVSTGPHLDFKVLDANGKPVDPLKYLASRS